MKSQALLSETCLQANRVESQSLLQFSMARTGVLSSQKDDGSITSSITRYGQEKVEVLNDFFGGLLRREDVSSVPECRGRYKMSPLYQAFFQKE